MALDAKSPGRPRDETIDDDVIRCVFELVDEVGPSGLTVEAIAERAGVSKSTIYRRWASKEDLLIDAVTGLVGDIEFPEGEGITEVLNHAVGRLRMYLSNTTAGIILPWMIGEVARGSDIGRRYADAVIIPGREALGRHIRNAIETGELRSDLDVDLAVDMLLGPLIVSKLLSPYRTLRDTWGEELIDALLEGWKSRGSTRRRRDVGGDPSAR